MLAERIYVDLDNERVEPDVVGLTQADFVRRFDGAELRLEAGMHVSLYMDIIDDDVEWETAGRTPFGFERVANAWGPNLPLEFVVPADIEVLKEKWAHR